jgi:DNA-binding PucR family transcriptional regulator
VHERLGFTALLLGLPRVDLDAFVQRQLGPILDRPDLLATLTAWHEAAGSPGGTAQRLGLHRNSVGARLARVGSLLGADLDDPAVVLDLGAAMTAREVLGALTDAGE